MFDSNDLAKLINKVFSEFPKVKELKKDKPVDYDVLKNIANLTGESIIKIYEAKNNIDFKELNTIEAMTEYDFLMDSLVEDIITELRYVVKDFLNDFMEIPCKVNIEVLAIMDERERLAVSLLNKGFKSENIMKITDLSENTLLKLIKKYNTKY